MIQNATSIQKQQENTDCYLTAYLYNDCPDTQTCSSLDSKKLNIDIYLLSPKPPVQKQTFNLELSNSLNCFKLLLINT